MRLIYRKGPMIIASIILILILWALYKAKPLYSIPIEILERNFGKFATWSSLFIILTLAAFAYLIYIGLVYLYQLFNKKLNCWIVWTILSMIFVAYAGLIFIDTEFGKHDIRFYLRNETSNIVGSINCTNSDGVLLVKEVIRCNYAPHLKNHSGLVAFTFQNESGYEVYMGVSKGGPYDFSFVAPPKVKRLVFTVKGFDYNNKERRFSIGNDFNFISEEKYNERKNKFKGYLIALLGIILFSIPASAVNFKKLTSAPSKLEKFEKFLKGDLKVKDIGKKRLEKIKREIER